MKKIRMLIIILLMVALMLLPVSASEMNSTNSTIIPATNGTGVELPVTTHVPSENTTMPVTNATVMLSTNTTPLPGGTTTVLSVTTATPVSPALPATQAPVGNITVASSPPGANILIDGVYYGTAPGNLTGIPTGNHMVRLALSGYYDYEGTIYVLPGQVTHVFGTLPPLNGAAPPVPTIIQPIAVTTIPPATVPTAQSSSGGPFENPAVIAAIIGTITACIGAGVTIFTHTRK